MKKLLHEVFGDRREATRKRKLHFAVDDVTKHVCFVVRICKRRLGDDELVHEDAERLYTQHVKDVSERGSESNNCEKDSHEMYATVA